MTQFGGSPCRQPPTGEELAAAGEPGPWWAWAPSLCVLAQLPEPLFAGRLR